MDVLPWFCMRQYRYPLSHRHIVCHNAASRHRPLDRLLGDHKLGTVASKLDKALVCRASVQAWCREHMQTSKETHTMAHSMGNIKRGLSGT